MVSSSLETERNQPSLLRETAMTRFKRTIAAVAAAATLGLGLAASSTPAAAWGFGWGYHHPFGVGAAVGLGVAAAAGAAAAASGPYYGGCYVTRESVRDAYGNYLYSRPVRVCD
jgi:hypothetical protein